jgi:ABC-type phosphate transport system substrate-binding protein
MMSFSGRRLGLACIVSAAGFVAAIAPATASAKTDLGKQCSGEEIIGHGSTFQAPIVEKWAAEFSTSKNKFACSGTQGTKGTPKVKFLSTGAEAGSGACLHGFGAENGGGKATYGERPYCGTDEAPSETQKSEIEAHKNAKAEANDLETIPVLQGAVAVIVHLPANCKASSEVEVEGAPKKLGRLVLDDSTIVKIYEGTIKDWTEVLANQAKEGSNAGHDELTGEGCEPGTPITPVVRLDHSGTTHIFKSFLEQVNPTEKIEMEEYAEEIGGKKTGCGATLKPEKELWSEVASACQNQRWPLAAHVVRGTESGNPGVVKRVNEDPSSIGYADLAVARKEGFFSSEALHGGENTPGEQNSEFWAEVQDTKKVSAAGFFEPSTDGDTTNPANSACKSTVYTNVQGKKFPPKTTRETWGGAKAELVSKQYAICGLTYDLALRQYADFDENVVSTATKGQATTVENFLLWAMQKSAEGGQALEEDTDYERLPANIIKESEKGIKEIGFEKG